MPRLVIGDDHGLFLDALSAVLAQRNCVVTVARTVTEMAHQVRREQPEVCLIDRHFSGDDGIEAISALLAAAASTKVIVLTADPDGGGVMRALRAGASGYVHKTRGIAALTAAIDRVLRGEVVVDVPKGTATRRSSQADDAHRLASYLTHRERQCLSLLVEGLDTAAMATKLGLSRTTVRTHVQTLLTRLGVHSRLEAAAFAVRYGLLEDSSSTRYANAM
jgi:two-component system, NarL family, nitrate/nitrite response regulator NarL